MPENKAPDVIWRFKPANSMAQHSTEKIFTDSATYIRTTASDSALKMAGLMRVPTDTIKYGCYVDDGHIYSNCVIDSGDHKQCVCASTEMAKEDCQYWRVVK